MRSADLAGPGLIVGLGNPGEKYRSTRHNLGFRVLDLLADRLGAGVRSLECNALLATCDKPDDLKLAWPQTYMNRSGYAVRCLADRLSVEIDRILVVYDDVMLPLARLRLRTRGGAGGHRGMESVIESMRTEHIARLRVGVGDDEGPPPGKDLSDYVLAPFEADERETIEDAIERSAAACEAWWRDGAETAMNRFNTN